MHGRNWSACARGAEPGAHMQLAGMSPIAALCTCFMLHRHGLHKTCCDAQVLGHSKTILVLLGGWAFLGDSVSPKQLCGMALAVLGMVLYGVASSSKCAPAASALTTRLSAFYLSPLSLEGCMRTTRTSRIPCITMTLHWVVALGVVALRRGPQRFRCTTQAST